MAQRKTRNKKGLGSIIHRKDGRYEIRIPLPTGGYKYYHTRDYEEALRIYKDALHDVAHGILPANGRQTFAQFAATWLEECKGRLRSSTWKRYETLYRVHLFPAFGKLRLEQITQEHIRLFQVEKQKAIQQGTLAITSVRQMRGLFSQILNEAQRLGYITLNPSARVRLTPLDEREMLTLSETEAQAFLEVASTNRLAALYVLALAVGMRQGELLGLRWKDVDLERKTLQIRKQAQRHLNVETGARQLQLVKLKTKGQRKPIILSQTAVAALKAHRVRQAQERLRRGSAWQEHDYVFPDALGNLTNPRTLYDQFKRLAAQANLPDKFRFPDLRHTAATLQLARGVDPKTVSEMLGHKDVGFTLRVYGHVTPHMQQKSADVVDEIFLAHLVV